MRRIFILEDDPARISLFRQTLIGTDVTICVDVASAKQLWEPPYDIVCLDHDLGGEVYVDSAHKNTGAEFVRWLTRNQPNLIDEAKTIYVHSYNPVGAAAMMTDLFEVHHRVGRVPFGPTLLKEISQ